MQYPSIRRTLELGIPSPYKSEWRILECTSKIPMGLCAKTKGTTIRERFFPFGSGVWTSFLCPNLIEIGPKSGSRINGNQRCNEYGDMQKFFFASIDQPNEPYTDFVQGGACLIVTGKWESRVMDYGSDYLGRWVWVTLRGRRNQKLTVVSMYRPNPGSK